MFNFNYRNNIKSDNSNNYILETFSLLQAEDEEIKTLDFLTAFKEGLTNETILTTVNEIDLMETLNSENSELLNISRVPNEVNMSQKKSVYFARMAYIKLITLINYCNKIIDNAKTEITKNEFKNAKSQIQILSAVMLNIYKSLGGKSTNLNAENLANVPTEAFCSYVVKANNTLKSAKSYILLLNNSVAINTINRQLFIMLATLNNQQQLLNEYLKMCQK